MLCICHFGYQHIRVRICVDMDTCVGDAGSSQKSQQLLNTNASNNPNPSLDRFIRLVGGCPPSVLLKKRRRKIVVTTYTSPAYSLYYFAVILRMPFRCSLNFLAVGHYPVSIFLTLPQSLLKLKRISVIIFCSCIFPSLTVSEPSEYSTSVFASRVRISASPTAAAATASLVMRFW